MHISWTTSSCIKSARWRTFSRAYCVLELHHESTHRRYSGYGLRTGCCSKMSRTFCLFKNGKCISSYIAIGHSHLIICSAIWLNTAFCCTCNTFGTRYVCLDGFFTHIFISWFMTAKSWSFILGHIALYTWQKISRILEWTILVAADKIF